MLWHYQHFPIAGHINPKHTLELMTRKYYQQHIAHKVKSYSLACFTGQCIRLVQHWQHGSIEPPPQPHSPWSDNLINTIVSLRVSCKKCHAKLHSAILVVVDYYTKQVHYFLCYDLPNSVGLAKILTRKLFL